MLHFVRIHGGMKKFSNRAAFLSTHHSCNANFSMLRVQRTHPRQDGMEMCFIYRSYFRIWNEKINDVTRPTPHRVKRTHTTVWQFSVVFISGHGPGRLLRFRSLGLIHRQWLNHPCHELVDHPLHLNQCQFHATMAAEFQAEYHW